MKLKFMIINDCIDSMHTEQSLFILCSFLHGKTGILPPIHIQVFAFDYKSRYFCYS